MINYKLIMISLRTHQPAWRAVQALQALLWCWRFMSSPKVEKTIWSRKMCLLEMILPKLRKFALCLRTWLECPILLTMDYTVLLMEKVRIIENCKKPPKITMLQKLSKCKVKASLYWNLIILLPLRFYMKSNFGEFKWCKNVIFANFRGSEFWF